MIEQTHSDRSNELPILEERQRGLVDGVIFHPVSLTPDDLASRRPGFPLVLLGEGPAPTADSGYRVVTEALDNGSTFDAVVCRDDSLAAGALHALHSRGRSVPDDVAVAGWDNLIISRHLWPPLTTVGPDKFALAEAALRLLKDRIRGHDGPGRLQIVESELVEREST